MIGNIRHLLKKVARPVVQSLVAQADSLPITHWGMEVDERGRLRFGGTDVLDLTQRHGSPLHILDTAIFDDNLRAFREPGLEVFYSVKTQPLPWIVKRLLAQGAGVEVISELELDLVLRLGAPPERVIYNGPAKSDRSLRRAIEIGVLCINVNHSDEIDRIVKIARELGRRAPVAIRVNTSGGWSSQFGNSIGQGEAFALYERALATPELDVIGLHSHRGRHIYTTTELNGFLGEVLSFCEELRRRLGFSPKILDLGGSLGIRTVRGLTSRDRRLARTFLAEVKAPAVESRLTPQDYARLVKQQVSAHFTAQGLESPRLVIEPGRALVGNSQALACRVVTTRESTDGVSFAILDAGINVAAIMQGERHQIYRVDDFGQARGQLRPYRLVGPICQPADVICDLVKLPPLSAGDTLLIMDSGAYFEPDSTSFSFLKPGTVALEGGQVKMIRRPETYEDLTVRDLI